MIMIKKNLSVYVSRSATSRIEKSSIRAREMLADLALPHRAPATPGIVAWWSTAIDLAPHSDVAWALLPEDALGVILSGLRLRDVLACRMTCRAWARPAAMLVASLCCPCLTRAGASVPALHKSFPCVRTLVEIDHFESGPLSGLLPTLSDR